MDQNGIAYPMLFLHPHVPTSSSTTKKTQVSLARFSMSQLTGLYRISQRDHAETSPPSSCLWDSLQMSLCFSAAALKIADDCTGAVCENVLFALSLPASVSRALQTFRFSQTLLCQLFFMIAWGLEDNSGIAVYRDSLSFRAGFLFLSPLLLAPSSRTVQRKA